MGAVEMSAFQNPLRPKPMLFPNRIRYPSRHIFKRLEIIVHYSPVCRIIKAGVEFCAGPDPRIDDTLEFHKRLQQTGRAWPARLLTLP